MLTKITYYIVKDGSQAGSGIEALTNLVLLTLTTMR